MVARLRDVMRLVLMLANDGLRNGQQIVSRQLDCRPNHGKSGLYLAWRKLSWLIGYGCQTRIAPGERRRFDLLILVQSAVQMRPARERHWVTLAQCGPRQGRTVQLMWAHSGTLPVPQLLGWNRRC